LPRLGRFRLAIGRLRAEMQALTGNDLVLPEIGDDLQRWASSVRESLDTPLE
jgi:hypothetical protein